MAKVFKGFNIHLESKAKVAKLREILEDVSGDNEDLADEIIEAIDEKVQFDSDVSAD